jgi:hypothetical protein
MYYSDFLSEINLPEGTENLQSSYLASALRIQPGLSAIQSNRFADADVQVVFSC